jgi:hypothetical protein
LLLVACTTISLNAAADEPEPPKPPDTAKSSGEDPSLDTLLLENLDDELLEGLDDLDRPAPDSTGMRPKPEPPGELPSELDAQLLEQLGEGEDIGQESSSPLVAIGRQMRVVEDLIGRSITSDRTQRVQGQIIAGLDQLIEELKSQCKSGQSQSGGGTQKPSSKPGGKSRGGSGENRGDNRPSRESADRIGAAGSDDAELDRMKQMLKHVWGHLPPKVREQMQSGTIEEFLPKYEQLIEDYYSRLAKDEI